MANLSSDEGTALTNEFAFPRKRMIRSPVSLSPTRRSFLKAPAVAGAFGVSLLAAPSGAKAVPAPDYLGGATEWLNSPPLTAAGVGGEIVLIDFWTYTCINWLRSLPYVRAWAEKYEPQGLVVIGVHTPEFVFEKNIDNVRRAAKDMRVDYPIAIDNDYLIWRAFSNQYWPALYFLTRRGVSGIINLEKAITTSRNYL